MSIFNCQPPGYTLIRKDGATHNRLRGDTVPRNTLVVVEDGRYFVRSKTRDDDHFEIYREGFATYAYSSQGE